MDHQAEALCDALNQALRIQVLPVGARLLDKAQHVGGDLVGSARPALARQQPHQTTVIEVALRFVEGWARYPEERGCLGNRLALATHTSKHLVSDLNEVARVEEITGDKSRILDVLRLRIGGAAFLERTQLGVGFRRMSHCKYNYARD